MKINLIKGLSIFVSILMLTNSCLSNDDEDLILPENSGYILFHNLSPGSETLKFFRNGDLIVNSDLNYNQSIGYIPLNIGLANYTVQSENNSSNLDTIQINLQKNEFYSLFAVNIPNNTELVTYSDNYTLPTSPLRTSVRFLQLSHNVPTVRVAIDGITDDLGTFEFKQSSPFIEIDRVTQKDLHLINVETNDTILSKNFTFNGGKVYTVFSSGIFEAEDENHELKLQSFVYQ